MASQLPLKGAQPPPPSFRFMSIVVKRLDECMKTPLGTEIDPRPFVLDGDLALSEWAQQPPSFRPMSIVATVAHLSYC